MGFHWAYFHDIWNLAIFGKSVEKIQVSLKSDKNNGTLHKNQYTFLIISSSVLLRMRNVSDKSFRENRNTHFKVIWKNQLDATIIYWSRSSPQHVWGNLLPIFRSVRLRFLQHMVSCCCGGQGFGERQRGTTCTYWFSSARRYVDCSPHTSLHWKQYMICCHIAHNNEIFVILTRDFGEEQ